MISPTSSTSLPSSSSRHAAWFRFTIAIIAFFVGGLFGFWLGQPLGYALAEWVGRDPAEVKDMLIWCIIATPIVMSALWAWLALILTGAGRMAKRVTLIWLILVTIGAVGILFESYDWPKASGIPVVDYELRLPAGMPLSDKYDIGLTVWNEKNGQGCYVDRLQHSNNRALLNGTIVVQLDNHTPTMSLRLPESLALDGPRGPFVQKNPEGYWRLPYSPASKLETEFSPWQKIEFIAAPRAVPPMPPGNYEIRYRLRHYM
jgi:hypothetical protein